MITARCPFCEWDEYIESEEFERAQELTREHVRWVHVATDDWGTCPNGMAAALILSSLGILDLPEAKSIFDGGVRKITGYDPEAPERYWLERVLMAVMIGLTACYGFFEGWLFHGDYAWWRILIVFTASVSYGIGSLWYWRRHRKKRQKSTED